MFTAMVLWTAFGSVFALLLGYSRIPYAAALDGYFFRVFGRLHPTKKFQYVALIVLGVISIICSFFSLDIVIDASSLRPQMEKLFFWDWEHFYSAIFFLIWSWHSKRWPFAEAVQAVSD